MTRHRPGGPRPARRDDRAGSVKVDVVEVPLALRCVLAHCPERWPGAVLDAAGQDNEIGRAQGTTAVFNGIVRQPSRSPALLLLNFCPSASINEKKRRVVTVCADG